MQLIYLPIKSIFKEKLKIYEIAIILERLTKFIKFCSFNRVIIKIYLSYDRTMSMYNYILSIFRKYIVIIINQNMWLILLNNKKIRRVLIQN